METMTYEEIIASKAAVAAFERGDRPVPLLSAETINEQAALTNLKAFATDYSAKFLALLPTIRPEWRELVIEWRLLGKSEGFLARVHHRNSSQLWREGIMAEQALGAALILGVNPAVEVFRPILKSARLEETPWGLLSEMIVRYVECSNYVRTAKASNMPTPKLRKLFWAAIAALESRKDLKSIALAAYLHSHVYQMSLRGTGLNEESRDRAKIIRDFRFEARVATGKKNLGWSDEEIEVRLARLHNPKFAVGNFVKILVGEASNYCGTVTAVAESGITVEVRFPSGRKFIVTADPEALKVLRVPATKRVFWSTTV